MERFEDIEAWKAAREIAQRVYSVTRFGDFGLRDQVQRAAVSIMANIAEGFDSGPNKESIRFFSYALSSVTELQSHLYFALDESYLDQQEFNTSFHLSTKCENLISGFTPYLRSHSKSRNLEPGTLNVEH